MLINLSEVLSEQHTAIDQTVDVALEQFRTDFGVFPVFSKQPAHIVVEHIADRELLIQGEAKLVIEIPCDRCLAAVPTDFQLHFEKKVDLDASEDDEADEELDEANYIDGYHLDVDKLLYNEILIGWPMKILCSKDCKGICSVCGQNLNEGSCNCEDTGLDPRMSVIRDVFKNFKEV